MFQIHVVASRVNKSLPFTANRSIGFPSNYVTGDVRFQHETGDDVLWWQKTLSERKGVEINRFGRGDPSGHDNLMIDLQFNFQREAFDRAHGGVFIRHRPSGDLWLAHRGIVTRGKSRVPRDLLLDEAVLNYRPVTVTNQGSATVLPVAPIGSAGFVADLREFCIEIRRAADAAMKRHLAGEGKAGKPSLPWPPSMDPLGQKLADYFDEMTGPAGGYRHSVASTDRRHGRVVRALLERLCEKCEIRKNIRMDLVALKRGIAVLFEVKTDDGLGSLYSAIGQLALNGLALARCVPNATIKRVVLVPDSPRVQKLVPQLRKLDIEVQTLEFAGEKVNLHKGLEY